MNRCAYLLLAGASFYSTAAFAQATSSTAQTQTDAAAGDASGNGSYGLTDIIVTAQKRSESVLRTPVSVTALNSEALQRSQVRELQDLVPLVPSLQMGASNGYAQITIRGIGISNFTPTAEGNVAVNLNEVYVSRTIAQLTGMFDVSALEVLRGPQGTLYGRNATAGSVNITTARPTDELSGFGRITVGNYGLLRAEGAVGGPITDKILVRLAAFREKRDGYGKNIVTGSDVDDKDAYGARATFVFRPTENFTATIIGEFYREKDNASALHYFGPGGLIGLPGALGTQPTFVLLGGYTASNIRDIANGIDPTFKLNSEALTTILEWNNGPVTLKSITGYRNQATTTVTALDGGVPFNGFVVQGEPAHQVSQELQARYDQGSTHLTVGAYYFHEYDDFNPGRAVSSNEALNRFFPLLPQRPVPGFTRFLELGGLIKTSAEALFAQATFDVVQNLSLTLGARYSWEKKHLFQRSLLDLYTPYDFNNPPPPIAAVDIPPVSFNAFTPKIGLNFQVTPETLLYASYSKGFRSGGFAPGTVPAIPYRPEKLTDYEGGIKTSLLNNRVHLALSGFYYDYTDLQVQQAVDTQVIISNAATAKVYGSELEFSAAITPSFTLDLSGSYLHTKYGQYVGADALRPFLPEVDFTGNRLSNAPTWRGHIGGTYRYSLPAGTVILHGEADYSSKFYFSAANLPIMSQEAFAKANASIGYEADANWHVTAYIKNMFNRTTASAKIVNSVTVGSPVQGGLTPPRTYGVEFGFNF